MYTKYRFKTAPIALIMFFVSSFGLCAQMDTQENIGVQFEDAITMQRIIIDDYEDKDMINRLDGRQGTWNLDANDTDTYCRAEVIPYLSPNLSQHVLRLDYDVESEERSQNGFWCDLMGVNAKDYDRFEFFIKGDKKIGFTSSLKIEFKKYENDELIIAHHTIHNITEKWQKISIPLSKFNAIKHWDGITNLGLIFHDRICDVKTGRLYVDGFSFVETGEIGSTAYDMRLSVIQKTKEKLNMTEWQKWKAKRLKGYPDKVHVKKKMSKDDNEMLRQLAFDTWQYFENIVDKKTHLPLDYIQLTKDAVFADGCEIGDYTNVTNVGLYFMAIVAAYDFGFINEEDAISRITNTLRTVEALEGYKQYLYNYYDTTTMERTSNLVSTVDSGWFLGGIYVVKEAFSDNKDLVKKCQDLIQLWDLDFFYDNVEQHLSHGFIENIDTYNNYNYGNFFIETRFMSYIAIAKGDVPFVHWLALNRTFPENYDWQTQVPKNRRLKEWRGFKYYGGYYEYNNRKYVPSWGGSLFEVLMPTMLLKERELSPESYGRNHTNHVMLHIEYAKDVLGYSIWGMSPCSNPAGGYSEYGVKVLGMKGYKGGVITPHASILAIEYAPDEVIQNIRKMISEYTMYGEYGLYDAVNPTTKQVSHRYLALDQGMILIALDNYLNDGAIRNRFHKNDDIANAEYLITEENFFE